MMVILLEQFIESKRKDTTTKSQKTTNEQDEVGVENIVNFTSVDELKELYVEP